MQKDHHLGPKRIGIVQNEKRPLVSQSSTGKK